MASKALLFAAVALAAFAHATAYECYVCNSGVTPDCAAAQGKDSIVFNCATQIPDKSQNYVCSKTVYDEGGVEKVQRNCMGERLSCKDLENQYKAQGLKMKDCKLCAKDLCNGQ